MNASFQGKMDGLGVSAAHQKVLQDTQVLDEEPFALLATEEKDIKLDIFEMFRAAGYELKLPAEQVGMKKLWFSCRQSMATSSAPAAALGMPPQNELPDETKIDLKAQWKANHAFVLPEAWLLSSTLQLKLWKAAMNSTAAVEAVLMENVRLL